jgi:anaerobic nitric oxide reductase transcription regulator
VSCAVGPTDLSVLLHGERGVGKSFLARVVHRKSARAERAFTHHRCERALPLDALLDDGTLFLEEVGDLPARTQDRILEAIREGRRRVRLVASTSRDLVSEGFRRELLERLSAVSLRVPPLRHRARDVPGLAQRFLDDARARLGRAVALSGEAAMELAVAPWTGNVPELRDHVLCAARACQGAVIERSHIETAARRREVNP